MKQLPLIMSVGIIVVIEVALMTIGKLQFAAGADTVQAQLKYQILRFAFAVLFLGFLYWLAPGNFREFFRIGNLSASTEAAHLLGIKGTESWNILGRNLSMFITLITAVVVYLQLKPSVIQVMPLVSLVPWIFLFAAMNSFSEETLYRFGVIVPGFEVASKSWLLIVSGALFGLVHFRGIPGGVVGSLLAGLLGWVLAKSVYETHGMFWAWFIHFLQDVVIFSFLFLKKGATG